jgi:hypothetical protein
MFSASSALMPGLPFAFFTPSLHFVTSLTLRNASRPPNLQLIKYYFQPQVDDLKRKLDGAKALSLGAAEEWYKGLEMSGEQRLAEAARWEQWETSGGLLSLATQHSKLSLVTGVQRNDSYSSSGSSHPALGTSPNGYGPSNSHSGWIGQTMPPIITPPAPGKLKSKQVPPRMGPLRLLRQNAVLTELQVQYLVYRPNQQLLR